MAAQVTGYWYLNDYLYDSYDHWRDYCLTHGINVDYSFGNQCWDSPALLWYQYHLRLETGNGYAYGCWVYERDANAQNPFIAVGGNASAVARKTMIKRGDCIVLAPSGLNYTGHICFADEDYNGTDFLRCLGQNQGQGTSPGTPSIVANLNIHAFLGSFRNTKWTSDTPTPVVGGGKIGFQKDKFPFVLYARKFRRNQR